jgi:hypothetical protein
MKKVNVTTKPGNNVKKENGSGKPVETLKRVPDMRSVPTPVKSTQENSKVAGKKADISGNTKPGNSKKTCSA